MAFLVNDDAQKYVFDRVSRLLASIAVTTIGIYLKGATAPTFDAFATMLTHATGNVLYFFGICLMILVLTNIAFGAGKAMGSSWAAQRIVVVGLMLFLLVASIIGSIGILAATTYATHQAVGSIASCQSGK